MTTYDPENSTDRRALAASLVAMVTKAKFRLAPSQSPGAEDVYEFDCADKAPGCKVQIFTSIVRGEVRQTGKDAIRIAATYKTKAGEHRHLSSETRVNRTGTIEDITERALERMRLAYKAAVVTPRCPKCKAPLFKSRRNNMVCAEACWAQGTPLARTDSDGFGNDTKW
jgi:hypothetical protein